MPAGLPLTLPTAYQAATLRFGSPSLEFEQRKDEYGALRAIIASSPSLLSESLIKTEKRSFERVLQIPVIKRTAISLVDGRICVLDGQEASTDMVTITFTVKGFRVKVPNAMLENNSFGYTELLSNVMYHGWHTWYGFMETNGLAFLETNKSTVLVDDASTQQYFTAGAGTYVGVKGMDFYSAYGYVLGRNFLNAGGGYYDVASGASVVTRNVMQQYGPNNQVNQAQFVGGATPYYTNYLVPPSGYTETHYLFKPGAVGLYHVLSPNAAANYVKVAGSDIWFSEKDPMFNYFDASVHFQNKCEERTIGYSGAVEPVYYDIYEYTIDTSFVKAYTSVNGESQIVKFNLANPA